MRKVMLIFTAALFALMVASVVTGLKEKHTNPRKSDPGYPISGGKTR